MDCNPYLPSPMEAFELLPVVWSPETCVVMCPFRNPRSSRRPIVLQVRRTPWTNVHCTLCKYQLIQNDKLWIFFHWEFFHWELFHWETFSPGNLLRKLPSNLAEKMTPRNGERLLYCLLAIFFTRNAFNLFLWPKVIVLLCPTGKIDCIKINFCVFS